MQLASVILMFLCITVPLCVTFILWDFIQSLDIRER